MSERNDVPCMACHACCRNERVVLSPEHGDDLLRYHTVLRDGEVMLQHKSNGDCIYLGETGCTIHDTAPWACRMFDCRKWVRRFPEAMQDLLLPDDLSGEVRRAGLARQR